MGKAVDVVGGSGVAVVVRGSAVVSTSVVVASSLEVNIAVS